MYCSVSSDLDLADYTLVLPTPCVGNIGQLAADMLIASINDVVHIGSLGHDAMLPFASANPFDLEAELTTAIEVYRSVTSKVVVIQIRSSLISKKCEQEFSGELVKWMKHHRFSKVVILTSGPAYQKLDCQIQDTRVRYVVSALAKEMLQQTLGTLDCKELEPREPCSTCVPYPALKGQSFFHGASYAKCIFSKCVEISIPSIMLMTFCAEGDNIPEAKAVADICDGLVPMVPVDIDGKKLFKTPPSWTHFFGNDPPPGLF